MSIQVTRIDCPACSAPLGYRTGMTVLQCGYCGQQLILSELGGESKTLQPHHIRAFRVQADAFKAGLLEWLSEGDYTPDDILAAVIVQDFTGLFVPFYRLTGAFEASFTGQEGYERTESYVGEERTEDGGTRPVTKHRTVTDWRNRSGSVTGDFDVTVCASDSVPAVEIATKDGGSRALVGFLEGCVTGSRGLDSKEDFAGLVALEESVLGDHLLSDFTWNAEEAFDHRGKAAAGRRVHSRCAECLQGDKNRNLEVQHLRYKDQADEPFYHPFWTAILSYKGELYHYAVCGYSDTRAGNRPVDDERKAEVARITQNAWVTTGITVIVGLMVGGITLPTVIVPILVFLLGLAILVFTWVRATKKKKAILARSKEIRRRVLEKVKAAGDIQKGSGLQVDASIIDRIEDDLDREEAAQEEEADQAKAAEKAEKAAEKAAKKAAKAVEKAESRKVQMDWDVDGD